MDEIGLWGVAASDFVTALAGVSAARIELHINSPGGDVFDGLAIYSALVDHPANLTTIVDGLAASAASFIAQAGDTRLMQSSAQMMIHEAAGGCWGDAEDMISTADVLERISASLADLYAARCGGDAADWRAKMLAETWFSAAEAIAAGLCDAEVTRAAAPEPLDVAAKLSLMERVVARSVGRSRTAPNAPLQVRRRAPDTEWPTPEPPAPKLTFALGADDIRAAIREAMA